MVQFQSGMDKQKVGEGVARKRVGSCGHQGESTTTSCNPFDSDELAEFDHDRSRRVGQTVVAERCSHYDTILRLQVPE